MVDLEDLRLQLHKEKEARKEMERLLGDAKGGLTAEFARFPEVSPHPIMQFSAEGVLLLTNPKAQDIFSEQIAAGVMLGELFPETNGLNTRRIIDRQLTVSLKVSQGEYFFQAHLRGVSDTDVLNIYLNDITNLERIKNEIEEDRIETEQLVASITSILVGINNDGVVTRWNTVAASAFSLTAQEAIGKHVDQCIQTWSLGTFDMIKEMVEGEQDVVVEDVRYQRPGQSTENHIDITITRVYGLGNIPTGYLILARDVTDKKKLEVQLMQAQKLESLGHLAAGIAHEINTPIQFIGDNTHFLENAFKRIDKVIAISEQLARKYKAQEPIDELIEEMESVMKKSKMGYIRGEIPYAIEEALKGLEQVASIVKGMKLFSHPGTGSKILIDINECINNSITVSRSEWKYLADLETDLDPALPPVMGQANELNQVILNMIVNAAHAIESAIETGSHSQGRITVKTYTGDDTVNIEITDTGTGMPEDVVAKIFDPFFTTKEPGKGTGQGLSIAHSVIRKHEGTITVESIEGEGTTFFIHLPAHIEG